MKQVEIKSQEEELKKQKEKNKKVEKQKRRNQRKRQLKTGNEEMRWKCIRTKDGRKEKKKMK